MAKYGSDDVKVEVDDGASAAQDLSQYVDTINGVKVNAALQEGHAMGDSWVEQLFTGLKSLDDINLEGFYDDTATTGPDKILFDAGTAVGATRTLSITYGSTKKSTVDCVIKSYERKPVRGQLHRFTAVLSPTGTLTEA